MSQTTEQIILTVAQAILANTELLSKLVDALPKETRARIEEKIADATPAPAPVKTVAPAAPTPVAPVPAPVVSAAPAPVAASPSNGMPPPPFPTAPAPVAAPATPVPFSNHQGMVTWVMDAYKALGPTKGARIQECFEACGTKNINDVKPEMYSKLVAGIEALKAAP